MIGAKLGMTSLIMRQAVNMHEPVYGWLNACGFSLAQVGRLIITHAHIDHYGVAGEVARQIGADEWMHRHEQIFVS